MDDFKCPGGLRVSRTRNTMILGCYCNYTGAPGYYCSRYSATPRFRTVRAELSLYALTNGLAIEQNNSGLSDLAEAFASRQGISTNEAVVELRTNNLPVYSVERGIAELRLDLYSRGLSRLPNVLSTCQIDDEGASIGRVRDVWEIPLANNSADPEVHVGEVVYPIPRDYPTGNSFAFCLTRKNLEFERFRSYHARYKPRPVDTVFAICMLALDTPLVLLTFSPPLDYSYSLILCVYATVGMLLTQRGDEDVILAPFFEQLLGPIMSVLLYTSTACPYTSESEFLDKIVLQGLQCWWDPRHAIIAALGLVLATRYFEQAYAFAARKSGIERVALPVVPAFDVLMLFVRMWLAVAQALGNLANLGLVLAPLLAVLLLGLVVLPVQVKQQPYFGTPFAHRVNDVVAGNLASQLVAAIVTVIARGWSYAHLFFVPCTWACMFAINGKRSKWSTKRLKRRLADSLTPEDEDIAFAYAHEYGLTSGFTHRILRSLGKSGQNAAALRLEKLCVQAALQQANANVNIMALKARDVVFPVASSSVFMSSAWTHVKVLNLHKLKVDDATASRLFDALSSLGNVSDLDLSENLLTLDSVVPFLRDVLPFHPGLARVNLLHNAGVLPFQISPAKVLCPLFASTRSCLSALCLHERALFNARWTVKIHRYHRDRATCDWMYELVSGLLEQPNVDLRLVLGRGPQLQQEAMRAIMECDSAGERVANIQVDDHTIDFANDEKLVALAHVDDPTLLVTCATRMPRLVEIDISYESTQRLGGFDFVQKLAEGISKRIRLVRVRDQFVDFDIKDENLGLCGRELWDEDAPIVARLLTFCPARSDLQLEGNRFGDRGIPVIVASALAGGKLRRLSLGSWKLGNRLRKAGAAALAELLFAGSSHSTLRELDLRHNQIGPIGCGELVQSRSLGQLRVLNLCGNAVSDEGAQACAEMLRTNRGLNTLRLCRSRISPQGAQAIAEALCVNNTLKELYLDWNEIVDEGCLAFAQNMPSFRGLRVLAMENNMIGDQGALGLSDLGNLEELYLGYNQIGDGGVLSLRDALADASHRAPRLSVLSLTGTAVAHLGDEMLRVATTSIQVDLEYKAIKQVRNRHLDSSRRDE
ncbi:Nucleotide-binding oligomerization domain-containing protein 2 [Hondaea fermentalgiana]|uniref:Nucleotide-binding oligomerization domain-containing protein 2 n=1 Tax=Hondaea fermentalgiana TaxID=2315210 RepID=A0A2R5G9G3_9STRA|nr:Nucleotide-binding oligomerization domain-containing protein 2 [Hondaea fermentalgiana]|eukprot:GBG26408.1 Nucleotide-binding oligomerization domain-containing protein 2 [Hondaea fermentalgiana]